MRSHKLYNQDPEGAIYRVIISYRNPDYSTGGVDGGKIVGWYPEQNRIVDRVTKAEAKELLAKWTKDFTVCCVTVVNRETYRLQIYKGRNWNNRERLEPPRQF